MPKFKVRRVETQELVVEAPDAAAAKHVDDLPEYAWGYKDETIVVVGAASEDEFIDVTVNLNGVEHAHEFDDEDTGGCIYCDEPAPAAAEA
jgi:hypothetical protein